MNRMMDLAPGDSYPALCNSVGLDCETCVADSATQLASVCKGLRGPMVTQLFVQIYRQPGCSRMAQQFAENYRQAAVREMPRPLLPATESGSEELALQVRAAVA
jgi:hypothetical protein